MLYQLWPQAKVPSCLILIIFVVKNTMFLGIRNIHLILRKYHYLSSLPPHSLHFSFYLGPAYFFFKKVFIYLAVLDPRIFIASCGIFHCGAWTLRLWQGNQLLSGTCDLSSPTRDWTCIPCITVWILNHRGFTREVPSLFLISEISHWFSSLAI